MAASLPLSLQERIMFFATGGSSPGTSAAAQQGHTLPRDKVVTACGAEATQAPTFSAPPTAAPSAPCRLSPSDVFVLTSSSGPGFVVVDHFLGPVEARRVAAEARARGDSGLLRPAGMGRGLGRWAEGNLRGDSIEWLKGPAEEGGTGIGGLLGAMEALRDELINEWGCGASRGVCDGTSSVSSGLNLVPRMAHQLARYDGDGKGYVRHRDAFAVGVAPAAPLSVSGTSAEAVLNPSPSIVSHGQTPSKGDAQVEDSSRRLTAIYYLNEGWVASNGGQLRVFYTPTRSDGTSDVVAAERHWDVAPVLDRLIIFRADRVDHMVLPAYRTERLAITTWLYGANALGAAVALGANAVTVTPLTGETAAGEAEERATPQDPAFILLSGSHRPHAGQSDSPPSYTNDDDAMVEAEVRSLLEERTASFDPAVRQPWPSPSLLTAHRPSPRGRWGPHWSHVTHAGLGMGGSEAKHPCVRQRRPLPSPYGSTRAVAAAGAVAAEEAAEDRGGDALTATIFVSVASYRDPECQHTLRDLFETAQRPLRVFVGVVAQYDAFVADAADAADAKFDASEPPCVAGCDGGCFLAAAALPACWAANVRCLCLAPDEAKGPCWARYLAQRLWRQEVYYLQIDSHMRFRPHWDAYLIGCLAACPSARPVLTAYPPPYTIPAIPATSKGQMKGPASPLPGHASVGTDLRPSVLCPTAFGADGMLRQTGKLLAAKAEGPVRSLLWAGGFSFAKAAEYLACVPYDPFLPCLFFGEEVSTAARLWTHGFDCFAPPEAVLYHLWTRDHRPVFNAPTASPQPQTLRQSLQAPPEATASAAAAAAASAAGAAKERSLRRVRALLGISPAPFDGSKGRPKGGPKGGGDASGASPTASSADFGRYGLGTCRSLESFEGALGVRFGPARAARFVDGSDSAGGGAAEGPYGECTREEDGLPAVVRADAKWGGHDASLFNENSKAAADQSAMLLTLASAMGRGF